MPHMYIMAYDDMFRSDSTIFRSLRAIYHATYSSKCAMGSHLHCSVYFFLLALQPPLGVVFYSPLLGFSLLAYEVS